METVIYFTTDYGKKVEMKIRQDRFSDLSIMHICINCAYYTGKQIRTAARENILLNYAEKHTDLKHEYHDC